MWSLKASGVRAESLNSEAEVIPENYLLKEKKKKNLTKHMTSDMQKEYITE